MHGRKSRTVCWLALALFCLCSGLSFGQAYDVSEMTDQEIIDELLVNLESRENSLAESEALLKERSDRLNERETDLETRDESLSERERLLQEREISLTGIETSLKSYADATNRLTRQRNLAMGASAVLAALTVWCALR